VSLLPAPVPGGPIDNVYCVNSSDCWAVGSTAGKPSHALIESYNGTQWALTSSPSAGGDAASTLAGVSCADARDCWAVGEVTSGSGSDSHPLIEHFDGSEWSMSTASRLSGALAGVSCMNTGQCWAVGHVGIGPGAALIEHYDGSVWSTVTAFTTGELASMGTVLTGVTCKDTDHCWAVGSTADGHALTAHHAGDQWSVVPSDDTPTGDVDVLSGVTCSTAGTCWAVGSRTHGAARSTLIETFDGRSWTIVASPGPAFSTASTLLGVACAGDTDCWAVGTATTSGRSQGLTEEYNGVTWVVARSGTTSITGSSLAGVTCPQDDDCWVVGTCGAAASPACAGSRSLIELYDLIVPDGH
jgi:hypothetical protein